MKKCPAQEAFTQSVSTATSASLTCGDRENSSRFAAPLVNYLRASRDHGGISQNSSATGFQRQFGVVVGSGGLRVFRMQGSGERQ